MPKRTAATRKARSAEQPSHRGDWQLQDAKARFSEVFQLARSRGPQRITRHGKEAVMVVPAEEFERLSGRSRQGGLVEFFAKSPLASSALSWTA
jgi:prevent-host-death family protein